MSDPATFENFENIFESVVSVLMAAGLFGFFFMLLFAGFKYLTAGSDAKAVEGAKKSLTFAIGGFVVFAFSYLIIRIIELVTGLSTGPDSIITNFNIKK